jgi:hypothetical protein
MDSPIPFRAIREYVELICDRFGLDVLPGASPLRFRIALLGIGGRVIEEETHDFHVEFIDGEPILIHDLKRPSERGSGRPDWAREIVTCLSCGGYGVYPGPPSLIERRLPDGCVEVSEETCGQSYYNGWHLCAWCLGCGYENPPHSWGGSGAGDEVLRHHLLDPKEEDELTARRADDIATLDHINRTTPCADCGFAGTIEGIGGRRVDCDCYHGRSRDEEREPVRPDRELEAMVERLLALAQRPER